MVEIMININSEDSLLLKYSRGLSIFVIVFGHVGGFWFYDPYSRFLLVVNAVFFLSLVLSQFFHTLNGKLIEVILSTDTFLYSFPTIFFA